MAPPSPLAPCPGHLRLALAACLAAALLAAGPVAGSSGREAPASPRLAALRQEVAATPEETAGAVEAFWREIAARGTPLVEPAPGGDGEVLVTFLWRGDASAGPVLAVTAGRLPETEEEVARARMALLPGTDVWYRTERLRGDARFPYALSPGDSLVPFSRVLPKDEEARTATFRADPLNPRRVEGLLPSVLELPDAPPQPWIAPRPGVPAGRIAEQRFASRALGNERTVRVYTPAGFRADGGPYPLLVLLDGRAYTRAVPTPTILDNLIAERRLPPLVAVLVDNPSAAARERELAGHPPFADFLAAELVPWARRAYRATADPQRTVVAGSSLGGLAAAFAAFAHPEVFGNVLSLSGSFYWKPEGDAASGWLARRFADRPKMALRFYLEAGLLEDRPRPPDDVSLLAANRRLRNLLRQKGYAVDYREYNGGHSYLNWRGSLADGLIALFGARGSAR